MPGEKTSAVRMVFTAPMAKASSSMLSRKGREASLCGMVRLTPHRFSERIASIAFLRWSGCTEKGI